MQPRERGKKKGSKVVRTGIDEKKVPIKYRFWDGRERGRHNLPQQKKQKTNSFTSYEEQNVSVIISY